MAQEVKKSYIHDNCRGIVDRRTLVCRKCGTRPDGSKVTLVRK